MLPSSECCWLLSEVTMSWHSQSCMCVAGVQCSIVLNVPSTTQALKMHMKSPLHQKKIRSPLSCKSQRVSSSSSLGAVAIQHKRPGSEFEVASTKLKILKRKDPGSEFQSARDPIPAKLEKNIEGTPIVPSVQMERTDKRIIQQGLDGSYTILPDKATTGKSVDDPVEVDSPVSVESSTQPEEPDVKHEEIDLTKESPYYCSVCMVDCVTPMVCSGTSL